MTDKGRAVTDRFRLLAAEWGIGDSGHWAFIHSDELAEALMLIRSFGNEIRVLDGETPPDEPDGPITG